MVFCAARARSYARRVSRRARTETKLTSAATAAFLCASARSAGPPECAAAALPAPRVRGGPATFRKVGGEAGRGGAADDSVRPGRANGSAADNSSLPQRLPMMERSVKAGDDDAGLVGGRAERPLSTRRLVARRLRRVIAGYG